MMLRPTASTALSSALLLALLGAASAGCSRKNPPDFSGTYNGKSLVKMTLKMPDGTTENVDPDAKPEDDSYEITDDDSPTIKVQVLDDEDHCQLAATRSGAKATITAGQTCVSKNGGDKLSLKVTSGNVALDADQATMDIAFSTSLKSSGQTVPGTMTLHFTGKR